MLVNSKKEYYCTFAKRTTLYLLTALNITSLVSTHWTNKQFQIIFCLFLQKIPTVPLQATNCNEKKTEYWRRNSNTCRERHPFICQRAPKQQQITLRWDVDIYWDQLRTYVLVKKRRVTKNSFKGLMCGISIDEKSRILLFRASKMLLNICVLPHLLQIMFILLDFSIYYFTCQS